jgi:hypothetical protein
LAKIRNPVRFSEYFDVPDSALDQAGVLNPTLNADTKLFIDPLLIPQSKHPDIRINARTTYLNHFTQVIKLLKASKVVNDVAWRNARRLMEFPEIKWTCLGYGAQSVAGSGSGAFTTAAVMQTAKEIVDLGIEDPDLFVALGLFEEGIGPDRISDMATNVILPDLLTFNATVLQKLGVSTKRVSLILKNGNSYVADLSLNPFQPGEPIILVPADILRDLPIAQDWSDVADAASKNAALRQRVNRDIGDLWRRRTLKDKSDLRRRVMATASAFETFLELLHRARAKPYDLAGDPSGEIVWRRIAETIADTQPFELDSPKTQDAVGVAVVVERIIEQFQFLIEKRRLSEELYHEGRPRLEKAAQRLFFAIAYAYCKANNVDLTPEADTGNGPVDFKVSNGFMGRVLVEIKLSTNSKLIAGYSRQLETYRGAEETTKGFYVVIDVGHMGRKDRQLIAVKNREAANDRIVSPIIFIDGSRRPSASKL